MNRPPSPETRPHSRPQLPEIDVTERGLPIDGETQLLDRRLFMQLLSFTSDGSRSAAEAEADVATLLEDHAIPSVLYQDVNEPQSLAVLAWSEDPAHFVTTVRPLLDQAAGKGLRLRPSFTMLGRTYASGFESSLEHWLIDRPQSTVLNDEWPWAIWYPLRRTGAFNRLERHEQEAILREHATIGRAYGTQDLTHDVRLACHGLDANDNEFVIGLVGKELQPLSHIVQAMRSTRQTAQYMEHMGPFFVGFKVWQFAG